MHLPAPLDTTIAHKAINLATDLSGAEKAVAGAIIDHFNRRTGQCDPSIERLARLLSLNRRTVVRAVERLHDLGIILRTQHGGRSSRNDYSPSWPRLRDLDASWSDRFGKTRRKPGTEVSPPAGHVRPEAGGQGVTQTSSTNQSKELVRDHSVTPSPERKRGQTGRERIARTNTPTRPSDAANSAAERRLDANLRSQLGKDSYVALVPLIDEPLHAAAIEAEVKQRGAGVAVILAGVRGNHGGSDA